MFRCPPPLSPQDSENQSKVVGPEPQYLDEFTALLVPDDTRVMVDVLKLAVSHRSGDKGRDVLSAVLSGMGTAYPQVSQSEHAHTHTLPG
jgi:E3 ubiquitin-protein ligase HERC2